MGPSILRLVLLITFEPLIKSMDSQRYQAISEFDNKVSTIKPLYNKQTGSLPSCGVLCGKGCNCFNFNLHTGTCLLYNSCNRSDMTVTEAGWRFFADPFEETDESEKTGVVALFMGRMSKITKNIYMTTKKGANINITTSSRLEPSLKRQIDGRISILSSHRLIISPAFELKNFKKEVKSVFIEMIGDASIVGLESEKWLAGTTAFQPLHKLSTFYVVISTEPVSNSKSLFALAAVNSNTSVSITFKMKRSITLYIDGKSYQNCDIYNLTLDQFETYQVAHTTDLTGTVVESSLPIAVFSGNDCNKLENIGYCDPLVEQLIPSKKLDRIFIVPPNSNNRNTKIMITAIEKSNISYTVDKTSRRVTLSKLDTFDIIISSRQTCVIESEIPIIVTSFGLSPNGSSMGDPSMTIVPGINQYIDYYKTAVPSGFSYNYVTVMMKQSLKDSIRINNAMINQGNIVYEGVVSVMNLAYNVRSIRVEAGELAVSTIGSGHFGLMFSGVKQCAAYGFSAINL